MLTALLWSACLGLAVPMLMLALECFCGTIGTAGAVRSEDAPPFTVLMPAHDEAAIIEPVVAGIVVQLRDCDRLIVIADNCTDGTAAIARAAGAEVITRSEPERRGKGYALEYGRAFVVPDRSEVIIIVDADCSPAPGALRRLAAMAAKRRAVVQGAYLMRPSQNASGIVRVSCFAFLVKNLVRQRGLQRLAGAALLQGSGIAFPWPIFARSSWNPESLVEDLELGVRLLREGETVLFDQKARFVSMASSQQGTAGQRRRWEHGVLWSMPALVCGLVAAGCAGRPRLWLVALDLLIPPTALLALAALCGSAILLIAAGLEPAVMVLLAADAALAGGLLAAWVTHGRNLVPLASLCEIPRYLIWKLPILARFVIGRERQWLRTERQP